MVSQHLSVFPLEVAERTRERLHRRKVRAKLIVEVAVGQVAKKRLRIQKRRMTNRTDDLTRRLLGLESGFYRFGKVRCFWKESNKKALRIIYHDF